MLYSRHRKLRSISATYLGHVDNPARESGSRAHAASLAIWFAIMV